MYYHKIDKVSIANGTGVRVVLWVSGCNLRCKGCHNPETWDFKSGKPFDEKAKQELFNALDKPYIKGLTLSGGHPLELENAKTIFNLVKEIKNKFPNKDIWLYTGYTYHLKVSEGNITEQTPPIFSWVRDGDNKIYINSKGIDCYYESIIYETTISDIIQECDYLVDGSYQEQLRDTTLPFRGSSNQRIIDIKASIKSGRIVCV